MAEATENPIFHDFALLAEGDVRRKPDDPLRAAMVFTLISIPFALGASPNHVVALLVPAVIGPLFFLLARHSAIKARRTAELDVARQPDMSSLRRACLRGLAKNLAYPFDADTWLTESGPGGPRVIIGRSDRAVVIQDGIVYEDFDVEAEIGAANLRRPIVIMILAVIGLVFAFLIFVVATSTRLSLSAVPALTLFVLLPALGAVWHFRLVPVLRPVALASIGRFEVTWFGRTTSYSRSDSVMFVTTAPNTGNALVALLRRDGKHHAFWFRSTTNPIFINLLARWIEPATRAVTSATATQTPDPS